MSASEDHKLLQAIASHFDELDLMIERALVVFGQGDTGSVDLAALHRARDAAQRGANIARTAGSEARSAFD